MVAMCLIRIRFVHWATITKVSVEKMIGDLISVVKKIASLNYRNTAMNLIILIILF